MAQPSDSHTTKSLLLIEPDAAIRQSLLNWLRSALPGCPAAGAASTQEAMALPQCEWPSVVVVDIAHPEVDGVETIRELKGAMRCAHVVALTMSDHTEYCESLACAGASASLPIWQTENELLPAITGLLAGESPQGEGNTAE